MKTVICLLLTLVVALASCGLLPSLGTFLATFATSFVFLSACCLASQCGFFQWFFFSGTILEILGHLLGAVVSAASE